MIISVFQKQIKKAPDFTPSITSHDNSDSRDQLVMEHNILIDSLVRDSMMEASPGRGKEQEFDSRTFSARSSCASYKDPARFSSIKKVNR